ncbi:MAG: peptide chain release factor 1 [bacterium]|nr:peptide chain release factor 1 [bacterium]
MNLKEQIECKQKELQEINEALMRPENLQHSKKLEKLNRTRHALAKILEPGETYLSILAQLESARRSLEDDDADIRALAEEEISLLETQMPDAEEQAKRALIPRDPLDDNDAILEIRAGAGGDEAALFAGDLVRMYQIFGEKQGWKKELVSQSLNDIGGVKEMIFELHGTGTYGLMKYESGVHRVQRVPKTEKQGRIHTSTATVAVLPVIEEEEFHIDMGDLDIEATTSTGAGGQSVNTTYSAIRIIHKPTGIMVYCQEERSQRQNKERALQIIRARVFAYEQEKKQAELDANRRSQIGTGDRSEKIRTYNEPQDRVTDHRIGTTWHNLPAILGGEIHEVIQELQLAAERQVVSEK